MATIKDILALIEEIAPERLAADWDNCGLMVGGLGVQVHKAALALDPTPNTIKAAHDAQAQALITHHPLIFQPLTKLDLNNPTAQNIALALKLGLTVISAHTNLDAARYGVNFALAQCLGLTDLTVIEASGRESVSEVTAVTPERDQVGIGCIGRFEKPLNLKELISIIKSKLDITWLRVAAPAPGIFQKAAVLGGSGGAYVGLAKAKGAQVLVSGDLGYHAAREAEQIGLCLIDAGHWATERPVLRHFARRLGETARARGLEVEFEVLSGEKDPWRIMEE